MHTIFTSKGILNGMVEWVSKDKDIGMVSVEPCRQDELVCETFFVGVEDFTYIYMRG